MLANKRENGQIQAIISDFDGTLVDTIEANFFAYREVLNNYGIYLTEETYTSLFGLNVIDLLTNIVPNISLDEINNIKSQKANCYPKYFKKILLNQKLVDFYLLCKGMGIPTALATTASTNNVNAILDYFSIKNLFDVKVCGEDVKQGKPHPECFLKCIAALKVLPENSLIFEDSEVGVQAAIKSGANYIIIDKNF